MPQNYCFRLYTLLSMIKKLLFLFSFSLSFINISFAQVGINTTHPRVTLDVTSMPSDLGTLDGIMIPQLSGDQLLHKLYTKETTSALVYVTAVPTNPTGQVANIDKVGFYYFDGALWQSLVEDSSTISNHSSSNENTIISIMHESTDSSTIVNSVSNRVNGNTLYTSVNGLESSAITLPTSNTLTSSTNTLTSTINGTAASAKIINSVSQTIDDDTFVSTTTVNGIASNSTIVPNIFTSNGLIQNGTAGMRIVDLNGNYLMFTGSVEPRIKIGDVVKPTATLDVGGTMRVKTLASGSTSDNVIVAGSDGILKQVPRSSFDTESTSLTYSVTSNTTVQITQNNAYQVIWCASPATTINLCLPTSSMVASGKHITIVCAAGTTKITGTLPIVQNSALVNSMSTGQRMTIVPVNFSGEYGWYVLDTSYGGTTNANGGTLITSK